MTRPLLLLLSLVGALTLATCGTSGTTNGEGVDVSDGAGGDLRREAPDLQERAPTEGPGRDRRGPDRDGDGHDRTLPPECPSPCVAAATRCEGRLQIRTCTWVGGCLAWGEPKECGAGKECAAGRCVVRACDGPGQCGAGHHCEAGKCASNAGCCKAGTTVCEEGAEKRCEPGPDGCGRWSQAQLCPQGATCFGGKCAACRHRPCPGGLECCKGTMCLFGYCLVLCDKSKGELNNPECGKDEYCLPSSSGGGSVCIPDGSEKKGAPCSIVKPCKYGLSCANAGKGYICLTDCKPSGGGAGNPDCESNELCSPATGTPKGGVCVPLPGKARKLYEACDAANPCLSPNLCVGKPGAGTWCLQPCDPTAPTPNCPTGFLCSGYDPSSPKKGICLQRCSKTGTKDICKYGQCLQEQTEKLCL